MSEARNTLIAGAVVLLHVAALWALQTGLLRRVVEVVVPEELLSQIIEPPSIKPPLPTPPVEPPPTLQPKTAQPTQAPAPQPLAIADPTPAPNAPTGITTPQPALPPIAAPVAAAPSPAPAPPPVSAKVEAPVIDADYAANEELFRQPKISERLREFGQVTIRVTVGTNGLVTHAEIAKPCEFERLNNAALAGAKKLKFRPATRGGVPIEYSYLLPVNYKEPK